MYKLNLTTVVTNHKNEPILTKDGKTFTIRELVLEMFSAPAYNPQAKIPELIADVNNRSEVLKLASSGDFLFMAQPLYDFLFTMLVTFRQPIMVVKCFIDNITSDEAPTTATEAQANTETAKQKATA